MTIETGRYEELRIHGVAGTPPESLLGLTAKPVDPASDPCGKPGIETPIVIYDPPTSPHQVQAYSWSSLTSGTASTALWVLLLPYMLANVAGWATVSLDHQLPSLPIDPKDSSQTRSQSVRWSAFLVRLAGLFITTIFALLLMLTVADLIGYQLLKRDQTWLPWWLAEWLDVHLPWLTEQFQWMNRNRGPSIGFGLTAVIVFSLFRWTRPKMRDGAVFKDRPWDDRVDPVGYSFLHHEQKEMWDRPGIIVRLGRLHFSWTLAVLAIVGHLVATAGRDEWSSAERVGVPLAFGCLAFVVLLLAVLSLGDGRPPPWIHPCIRWVAPAVSISVLALATVQLWMLDDTGALGETMPYLRQGLGLVGVGLLIFVLVSAIFGSVNRLRGETPMGAAWNQPGLLFLAAAVGTVMGAGIALQVERFAKEGCECSVIGGASIDWVAIVLLWAITALTWFLLVPFGVTFWTLPGTTKNPLMVAVAMRTQHVSPLLALITLLGVAAIVGLVGLSAAAGWSAELVPLGEVPSGKYLSIAALAAPIVLLILAVAWRSLSGLPRLLAVGLIVGLTIGLTFLVLRTDAQVVVLGSPLPPRTLLQFAQFVSFLVPITLVTTRLVSGLRSRQVRRGLGVLWDVGAFWPRWFHPFAPPTYSDRAVTDLTKRLESRDVDHPLVLAPHSQGSIIASAAIANVDPNKTIHHLGLLTYGSPWSRLYARAFPAVFSQTLLTALCERLATPNKGLRWRNLFRESDPVGSPIHATPPGVAREWEKALREVDCDPLVDGCGRAHSGYWFEDEYKEAVAKVGNMLLPRGPNA